MNEKLPESTPDEEELRGAELEALRSRDLLGFDISYAPIEERILARTLNKIEAEELRRAALASVDHVEPPNRRWRHLPAKGLVAASIIVLFVVAVTTWNGTPALAVPPGLQYTTEPADVASAPDAQEALAELEQVALTAGIPGDGTVQYVSSSGWRVAVDDDQRSTTVFPSAREFWVASDGSGVALERQGVPLLPDGTLDPSPSYTTVDEAKDVFPPGSIDDAPSTLSRDPALLKEQLFAMRSPECREELRQASCLLDVIVGLATSHVISGELNATFWQMLSETPNVHTLGQTHDRLGRSVVALAGLPIQTEFETVVLVILVDSATGRFVGEERVTLESSLLDIDEPAVTSFTTLIDAKMVQEVGDS
ncbi:hypothetical protein SAMN06298212_11741 [Ruaniaceae bacterium KH17]|nr:hypothetical protein SAMN06298212_11741 [Ruaniaceae bacterium KH17]